MKIQYLRENRDQFWFLKQQRLALHGGFLLISIRKGHKDVIESVRDISNKFDDGYNMYASLIKVGAKFKWIYHLNFYSLGFSGLLKDVNSTYGALDTLQRDLMKGSDFLANAYEEYNISKINEDLFDHTQNRAVFLFSGVDMDYDAIEHLLKDILPRMLKAESSNAKKTMEDIKALVEKKLK